MPVFTLEESNYAGPIPEDEILGAEVIDIKTKEKPFKDDDGNAIVRLEFSFIIKHPGSAWDEQRIWGDTSTTFNDHPNCRLRAWAQELLGQELPKGFRLDTDTLRGLSCRIVVGASSYTKNDEEKTRNFVKDVLRAKPGAVHTAIDADEEPF